MTIGPCKIRWFSTSMLVSQGDHLISKPASITTCRLASTPPERQGFRGLRLAEPSSLPLWRGSEKGATCVDFSVMSHEVVNVDGFSGFKHPSGLAWPLVGNQVGGGCSECPRETSPLITPPSILLQNGFYMT